MFLLLLDRFVNYTFTTVCAEFAAGASLLMIIVPEIVDIISEKASFLIESMVGPRDENTATASHSTVSTSCYPDAS
jgi:hypothetical protein